MKIRTISVAGLVFLSAALPSIALADSRGEREEKAAFSLAKISLTDAIAIAEEKSSGRAMSAEFEKEDGAWIYAVEVIQPNENEVEVCIDASSGSIIKIESED